MNLNATLFLQSIAMMIFVWFCMKFIWPVLLKATDERRAKIADGLAASGRAERALQEAEVQAQEQIRAAREQAAGIVEQANQRHAQILDQARDDALAEKQRQVTAAQADIKQSANQAREVLRTQVAGLAVLGAERLLGRAIDADVHRQLLDELIADI